MHDFDENEKDCYMDFIIHKFDEMAVVLAARQRRGEAEQSKADLVKKQKIVEDKTFGLKNKNRSKNVQKYVQNLKQYVQPKLDPSKLTAKKKKEEKAKDKELNDLFKIAVSQPKVLILSPYCERGKIDLYSDKCDEETMEDWDQDTLEKVVESKKTEYNQNKPTDMVCTFWTQWRRSNMVGSGSAPMAVRIATIDMPFPLDMF
ncbi:hypothetical protein AAZX31_19G163100 [Glycine max]